MIVALDARLAFDTLDPNALHEIAPTLPTDITFGLPDASGLLTLTLTALDELGRTLEASAQVTIVSDEQPEVTLVIGGDLMAHCRDGQLDQDESDVALRKCFLVVGPSSAIL